MKITDAKNLDQFYTNPKIANICWQKTQYVLGSLINLKPMLFMEPCAGNGSFYNLLPKNKLGFDIDPKIDDVIKADFFEISASHLKQDNKIIIIGNPPFGKRGKLALQFLNESFKISHFICFVLPVIFRKWSIQSKINPLASLLFDMELPKNSFVFEEKPYNVHCCFQIWTSIVISDINLRLKEKPEISHPDFDMWQYNNTEQALCVFENKFDFAVPRQGYQDYSRREFDKESCEKNVQWILFKAKSDSIKKRLMSIDYEKLAQKNTTIPGFGKADLVLEYKEILYGKK